MTKKQMAAAEELAKELHSIYEALAPDFDYKVREESCVLWDNVPEINKKLMIQTCAVLLDRYTPAEFGYFAMRHRDAAFGIY